MVEAQPVRVLGRYAICDTIGSGGMATVHIGRLLGPVGFSRTVAIKRMHPHLAHDPEFVAMFLDEARVAARVQHANVVSTIDVVTEQGELFLVMEYVEGESFSRVLRSMVQKGVRLPLPVVGTIVSQALNGLHAVHESTGEDGRSLDLIHRDVSPDNVIVGRDGTARVLDFGIAKAAEHGRRTQAGQVKGKAAYMAPEQIAGENLDRRTDIYAASAMLWEALTGRRLVEGSSDTEVIYKLLKETAAPPSSLNASLSPEVDALVMKGLSKKRDDRFATAQEMAIALENALGVTSPSAVGRLVEGILKKELDARAEVVATAIRRTADLKSGSVPSAANILSPEAPAPKGRALPRRISSAATMPAVSGPFAPSGAAAGVGDTRAADSTAGTLLLGEEPVPALDLPSLELPGFGGAPPDRPHSDRHPELPALTAGAAANPVAADDSFDLPAFGGGAPSAATMPALGDAPATPQEVSGGSPLQQGLGGGSKPAGGGRDLEIDFGLQAGPPSSSGVPASRVSSGGVPAARVSSGGVPAARSSTGGRDGPQNMRMGPMARDPLPGSGAKSVMLPLLLAGAAVAVGGGYVAYSRLTGPASSASATPAPPMGVDAQRSCDALRRRARSGAQVIGLSRDGWVAELWLRGRGGANVNESAIDFLDLQGSDPESHHEKARLSAMGKSTDEGVVVRLWGPVVSKAFEAEGATRLIKASDLAFERSKAEAGALYLRCSHLQFHDVGLWFRGDNLSNAASSLLFAMGTYSDVAIIRPGTFEGPGVTPRPRLFESVADKVKLKPMTDLETDLQRHGATMTTENGSVRIVFPVVDPEVALRASRVVAGRAEIESR